MLSEYPTLPHYPAHPWRFRIVPSDQHSRTDSRYVWSKTCRTGHDLVCCRPVYWISRRSTNKEVRGRGNRLEAWSWASLMFSREHCDLLGMAVIPETYEPVLFYKEHKKLSQQMSKVLQRASWKLKQDQSFISESFLPHWQDLDCCCA